MNLFFHTFTPKKHQNPNNMNNYLYLALAIIAETMATTALKMSEQFTRPLPSVVVVIGYAAAFYLLSLSLRTIPIGVAYAVWSAVGIVLVTVAGMVMFKQVPDLPAVIGLLLIIAGVVTINVFSRMSAH